MHTLVVDKTRTMAGALQLQAFGSALSESGLFDLQGVEELSREDPPPAPPYELVVVIPASVAQVWIVTPAPPAELPARLRAAFEQAKHVAEAIYGEQAERPHSVVDVSDDLGVLLHAAVWKSYNWLQAPETEDQ